MRSFTSQNSHNSNNRLFPLKIFQWKRSKHIFIISHWRSDLLMSILITLWILCSALIHILIIPTDLYLINLMERQLTLKWIFDSATYKIDTRMNKLVLILEVHKRFLCDISQSSKKERFRFIYLCFLQWSSAIATFIMLLLLVDSTLFQ